MNQDLVMLLIDADNVSIDVMDQAVRLLLKQHGGLHVRRAYCTAESAVKHQSAFKRLGIKPMVNLAAGKNSTDIAMAVDAIDLVVAERPGVVVIASSDSDFAPLVQRLREKGCVVRGIGQLGKTGTETQEVYDDFTVLEHRRAGDGDGDAPRKTAARKTAARKRAASPAEESPAAAGAAEGSTAPATKAAAKKATAKPSTAAVKTAARKTTASRKTGGRRTAPEAVPAEPAAAPPTVATPSPPPPAAAPARPGATSFDAVLACLPELERGQGLALNVAAQRLREAQLLGRHSSSVKLFALLSDRFELVPTAKPSQVRLRR